MTKQRSKRFFPRGLSAVLVGVPLLVGVASGAGAAPLHASVAGTAPFSALTLQNGWTSGVFCLRAPVKTAR